MQNVFTNNVSILINDQPISQEFHLYEAGYEKCRPTKPTEFAPLIIGFCIIVAMVKAIFQHPLWKNNTLPLAICL